MDVPPPPEISQDEVPFEKPRGRIARLRELGRRARRKRESIPSPAAISIFILVFAGGAATVGSLGSGLLLFAWLMAGPLAVTIYLTRDAGGSLINPYTLFFAAIIAASLGAYMFLG